MCKQSTTKFNQFKTLNKQKTIITLLLILNFIIICESKFTIFHNHTLNKNLAVSKTPDILKINKAILGVVCESFTYQIELILKNYITSHRRVKIFDYKPNADSKIICAEDSDNFNLLVSEFCNDYKIEKDPISAMIGGLKGFSQELLINAKNLFSQLKKSLTENEQKMGRIADWAGFQVNNPIINEKINNIAGNVTLDVSNELNMTNFDNLCDMVSE